MSEAKDSSIPTLQHPCTKSRRIQIITNFVYLISILDFLLHYTVAIELGLSDQIYQSFHAISPSNSTAISLCKLPMEEYLSFHISQMSLYIFYLSFLTLVLSIEAIRKSSFQLYRFYILMKFTFALVSVVLCTTNTVINLKMASIQPVISIPYTYGESNSILLNTDICLIHTRESMAAHLLAVLNVFVFVISIECSKIFPFRKSDIIQV